MTNIEQTNYEGRNRCALALQKAVQGYGNYFFFRRSSFDIRHSLFKRLRNLHDRCQTAKERAGNKTHIFTCNSKKYSETISLI